MGRARKSRRVRGRSEGNSWQPHWVRRPKFLGGEATRRATRRQALARQIPYNRGIAGDCCIVGRGFMFCRSLPDRTPFRNSSVSTDRRTFLKTSVVASAALGLEALPRTAFSAAPATAPSVGRAEKSLNILILGGTGFTGPEQVEYAIARGHRVTLFNRNKTRPNFFKGRVAEELIGDLNSDTSALEGKKFDVVIDNPTPLPAWVRNAGKYLAGNTKHYMFISTTSVYRDESQIGIDENSPTTPMPPDLDPYTLDPASASKFYGALKTRAEQ